MNDAIEKLKKNPQKYSESLDITKLEKLLRHLSDAYYNTGTALVDDDIFDIAKEVLEKRNPENKFLKEVGAPVTKKKIKLPYPMGSLDKIKPDTAELEKWVKKYKGPYVLSDKLDGISAQLYKNDKGEFELYSRGNGIEGQDITHLIKLIMNKKIKMSDIPKGTSIRGEIIISKDNFKSIENTMANARNAAAGLVNSKTVDKNIAKITEFVTYSIIHPSYKQTEQMDLLKKWDFNVVEYKIEKQLTKEMLGEYLLKRRKESKYEVDGIVVVDSSKEYKVEEGNPDYAFAFKAILKDQVAKAKVVDVLWSASKDGLIKPTIQIEPVKLVGTTITYATAFNAKYVVDNKLGPGAIIKLVRSGDVIPHILEVLEPAKEPKLPDVPYKWSESGVDIMVKDLFGAFGDTIKIKRIVHFFKTLDVKFISEGLVKKLVENGYDSIEKILSADKSKLQDIDGMGDKMVEKIYDSIEKQLHNTNLQTLMAATNIFGGGLGVKKLKLIIDKYPNIMNEKWSKNEMFEKINSTEGFSDITTSKFIDNLDKFKKYFEKIDNIMDLSNLKKKVSNVPKKTTDGKFKDQVIVFTGFRNKEWEKIIEENGGKISNTVSGKTTLVVHSIDSITSSKIQKASKLNIKTMSTEEFEKTYL
ncbi:NAD-dependent DNA ligase [Catovirus CTV1]|uniref:DNA ligase (NAD(+)) n=1 Tax=Catovirus CTV1 TaxID=1977631 RepID=A0A1V0SB21_9VIRU|nr:NAD-dependent DNA ligase [Catovirus CTV1]